MTKEEIKNSARRVFNFYGLNFNLSNTNEARGEILKASEQQPCEKIWRWIPVSERLPEVDVDVLVTDNGGGVPTVIIDACGVKDDTGERFWYISQVPVAWMEWPKPYKEESEDKK